MLNKERKMILLDKELMAINEYEQVSAEAIKRD